MLQDVPLLAQVRAILNAHKAFGKHPEFLSNYLLQAESAHEVAACLIALRIETGQFVGDSGLQHNKLTQQGLDLATRLYPGVVENLHRGFEKQVLTKTYNAPKVTSDFSNVIQMSDAARSDERLWKDARGSNYVGARMVQPKTRYLRGHYWDRKTGANVTSY